MLILDDPAVGLDKVARRALVESMIYLTRRSDRTIFFSTHQLPDVERVADHIAVLDQSVLRACCPLETFRNSVRQVRLRFPGAPPALPKIPGLLQAFRSETELRVTCAYVTGNTTSTNLWVRPPRGHPEATLRPSVGQPVGTLKPP